MDVSKVPLFFRALLAAGVSLALTSCKAEGPDNGADNEAIGVVTSELQTSYDFIVNAPGAAWYNNDGILTWGTNSTGSPGAGACLTATGVLESGASAPFLNTNPKVVANGFLRGSYSVTIPDASRHPTLTATFGFKQGASASDGVTFSLATQVNQTDVDSGQVRSDWVPIFSQKKTYTGALSTVTADLSAYGGQTIQLALTADAGASGASDWAVWTDVRVVADNTSPPTACSIGGVGYANGDVNPASSCQICDPKFPTTWTIRGDACLIGGQCYNANVPDSLGCRRCDPGTSQTAWTNNSACTNLVIGATNWSGAGNFGSVAAADNQCQAEGAAVGLPGTWRAMVSNVRDLPLAANGPKVTVSGFVNCGCLNGTFSLAKSGSVWSSGPITGCPGQATPAYMKFVEGSNGFGIANSSSTPGSGDSDYSPASTVQTTPWFQASGGGSVAGNITTKCPGGEDLNMSWTVDLGGSMPVVNLKGEQLYPAWNSIFANQVWAAGPAMYMFGSSSAVPYGGATTTRFWTGVGGDGYWANSQWGTCTALTAPSTPWTNPYFVWPFQPSTAFAGDFGARAILNNGALDCRVGARLACLLVPSPTSVTVYNPDNSLIGVIQGTTQGNSHAFLGVPYAAPPIKDNRFKVPQPVAPLSSTLNTFNFKPACVQKGFLKNTTIGSEDCLYLNIWKPKSATAGSNLPVFVFHHGGGLLYGSATAVDDFVGAGTYNGDRLATAQNMIVVTLQTRLGPMGYLASTELSADPSSSTKPGGGASGNYGLLDALQALKWIKKNIYNFGGDPNKVTFAGQSGGATLVAMLLASPLALDASDNNKPYFSSAYLMSGFYEEPSKETRYNQASAMMASLKAGCTDNSTPVKCLRTAPVANFLNATDDFLSFIPNALNGPITPDAGFGLKFGPNVDGYVLPNQPRTIYADTAGSNHPKVPVILGTAQKEFWSFLVTGMMGILNIPDITKLSSITFLTTCNAVVPLQEPFSFVGRAQLNLGAAVGAAAASLYPCTGLPLLGPNDAYSMALTHAQYECPARRAARALIHGQTQPVRRYMFTHNASRLGAFQNLFGFAPQIGAAHALDLMYLFNTHPAYIYTPGLTGITFPPLLNFLNWLPTYLGPSPREADLTNRYQTFIRNFAATGDPNCSAPGTCTSTSASNYWTQYSSGQESIYSLKEVGETGLSDPGPQMIGSPNGTQCDFWDQNFAINGVATCTPSCSGKVCGSDGCGGTCGTCGSGQLCSVDQSACLSTVGTAAVSGFTSCSCLNGTFPLTNSNGVWSSQPITGCPGQTQPAYVKFRTSNNSFGITNQSSQPGSGNSDYSPGTVITTSPFKAGGGGSQAGNINSFCPGSEDRNMSWTVSQ